MFFYAQYHDVNIELVDQFQLIKCLVLLENLYYIIKEFIGFTELFLVTQNEVKVEILVWNIKLQDVIYLKKNFIKKNWNLSQNVT